MFEYLFPTNTIASIIVILLILSFFAWLTGLIFYWFRLSSRKREIEKNQNIQPLVDAQEKRVSSSKKPPQNVDAEEVFSKFCKKQSLSESSSVGKHLKSIFLAGWEESRLEVSELINHTTSDLFKGNGLFRSVLAVFIVIGLLGTLFGLTDSLTELSPALRESTADTAATENSQRMTQALGDLMDDIKGAFAPSIWGIVFTILGVIFYGVYLLCACHPVKTTLERLTLTVWVPQLYPTTSQKLIQTLQQSESQMQKGFETAAQFSESVKKVHGNIDEFNASLTQATAITQPLSDSVIQINKAALDISTAVDVLNTGFTENLDKFSREFAASVTHLAGFQDEIRNLHQQFQDAANQKLDQQTQKLVEQSHDLVKVLNTLKSYEDAYIKSREQIDETLQKFISIATETNTSIHAHNREWFEKINTDNHKEFSKVQGQLKADLTELQQTLENGLTNLTGALAMNLENVQRVLDERLEVLNNRLDGFDTPLRETIDEVRQTFDERLETLNNRLENFDLPLKDAADQMRGTFQSLVKYMQRIVGDLQKEIKEQNESYEEQLAGVKHLNESVVGLLKQLDESSKDQKGAVNTLNGHVGGLTTDIKTLHVAINAFTSDSGELSQSIGAIKGDIEKLGTASQQFVEKVEKADVTPLTANIGNLNAAINEISGHSQVLANAVNGLAKQINSPDRDSSNLTQQKIPFLERIRILFRGRSTSTQTRAKSQSKNSGSKST